MFEAQVASILRQHLSKFVLGLDADALSLGIWSGEVSLVNLQAWLPENHCFFHPH